MKSLSKTILTLSSAFCVSTLSVFGGTAEPVTTQPVGYTTLTIEPGLNPGRVFSAISLPLYAPASSIDGITTGVVTGVSADSIASTGAGWTTGALANPENPYCVRITSGDAEGLNLLISENFGALLRVNSALSMVDSVYGSGVRIGDSFEIIEIDTLASLFGTPADGIIYGGSAIADADQLRIFSGTSLSTVYFDTDVGYWTIESNRGQPDLSNMVILPDAGILVSRNINVRTEMILPGTVPNTNRLAPINALGYTFLGNSWPVDMTLSELGLETISEWNNSLTQEDPTGADTVLVFSGGSRSNYYYDGTNWRRPSNRGSVLSNDVEISSGSAVLILKGSAASSSKLLSQNIPYTL